MFRIGRISDNAVKRWDMMKKVIIFVLIFGIIAGYASTALAAGDLEGQVKGAVAKALKIICGLGAVILGVIGVVDIIVSISTEDTHRRTTGIIMVGGAVALGGLTASIDSMLGGGGTSFLLPAHKICI